MDKFPPLFYLLQNVELQPPSVIHDRRWFSCRPCAIFSNSTQILSLIPKYNT